MATKRSIQTFMSAQKKLNSNYIQENNSTQEKIENKSLINNKNVKDNDTINNTGMIHGVVKELVEKMVEKVVNNIEVQITNIPQNINNNEPEPTEINQAVSIVIPEGYFPINLNENEKYDISIVDSNTKIYYITETMDVDQDYDISNNNMKKEKVLDTKISGKFNCIIGIPIKSNEKTVFYTYFNSIIFNRTYKNSYNKDYNNDLELITPEKITFEIKSKLSDENKIVLNLTLQFKKLYKNKVNNIENTNNTDNINTQISSQINEVKLDSSSNKLSEKTDKNIVEKKEFNINNNKDTKSKSNISNNTQNKIISQNKSSKITSNTPAYSMEKLLNVMNKKLSKFVR